MPAHTTPHPARRHPLRWLVALAAGAILVVFAFLSISLGAPGDRELDRLVDALGLTEGMTVAEIGAGTGWLTVEVARTVGPSGQVYSTELSPTRLDDIRTAVREAGLDNVTVVAAGERATNLEAGCCDAVFMRRVYHHFAAPAAIVTDLERVLKPGGRVAIIEFESSGTLGLVTRMGIDREELVAQVSSQGFEPIRVEDWPSWGHYVAVFRASPP